MASNARHFRRSSASSRCRSLTQVPVLTMENQVSMAHRVWFHFGMTPTRTLQYNSPGPKMPCQHIDYIEVPVPARLFPGSRQNACKQASGAGAEASGPQVPPNSDADQTISPALELSRRQTSPCPDTGVGQIVRKSSAVAPAGCGAGTLLRQPHSGWSASLSRRIGSARPRRPAPIP